MPLADWGQAARHIDAVLAGLKRPEAIEAELIEVEREADMIADAVGCPECAARAGEPCRGIATGFHFERGLAFAERT